MFNKDGRFDEENSFKIVQLPLKNTSDFSVTHPIFDSNQIVDNFKAQFPVFAQNYIYNGVWTFIEDHSLLQGLANQ